MSDRMDIDALLIGALYGELTPADEARLTAHLESHPADRTALADLTRTRATVRESRLLTVQFEPPQSVSALLLQEAARRSPRSRPERETTGWFYRFTRTFMAHPAMAAAAMLVLVVGVASILYARKGVWLAETAAPPAPASSTPTTTTTESAPPPAAAAPAQLESALADQRERGADSLAANQDPTSPAAPPAPPSDDKKNAGSGNGYRVGLGELRQKADEAPVRGRAQDLAIAADDSDSGDDGKAATGGGKREAPPAKAQKKGGVIVQRPELQPRDIDDSELKRDATAFRADTGARAGGAASGKTADKAAGPRPGFVAPAESQPPAPEPAPATIAKRPPPPANDPKAKATAKPASRTVLSVERPPAAAPAAAPPRREAADRLAPGQGEADNKLAEEKSSEDRALISWAQKQHDQVIAQVKSNNCRAAARLAMEIYSRAPDYYARNVATDRAVKPCSAYLNDQEERNRAAKRALQNEAPAPPPPVRK